MVQEQFYAALGLLFSSVAHSNDGANDNAVFVA